MTDVRGSTMRILYLSLSYVASRRASSMHVMNMCAALARRGHRVTLVTKRNRSREEGGVDDDFDFYGVEPGFEIVKLPRPSLKGGGLVYLVAIRRLLGRRRREIDLVYSRDLAGAWLAARMRLPVLFEAHGVPRDRWSHRLHRVLVTSPALRRLVVISRALQERLAALGLTPGAERTVVAHDAANPFPPPAVGKAAPRPGGKIRIGYVGHLYPGRGVGMVVELARRLPECEFHLVGGRQSDVERWRREAASPNLVFHGFAPPAELPALYAGFDILLMPYQRRVEVAGGGDTSAWMSPMKMFEYMAAGRAIVASDLPVLREVLADGDNALLVPPEDAGAWETAVRRLLEDPALGHRLGDTARRQLHERHTWDRRAEVVLAGLDHEIPGAAPAAGSGEIHPAASRNRR